jgi:hypothetical protein
MICYVVLDIDMKQLETCMKSVTKIHSVKNNHETGKYSSLKQLKEIIIDCYNLLKKHICTCLECNKEYNFDKLDKHICNNKLEFINPNIIDDKVEDIIDENIIKKLGRKTSKKIIKKKSTSKKSTSKKSTSKKSTSKKSTSKKSTSKNIIKKINKPK